MPKNFLPTHGGQLRELAAEFGIPETSLVDFSASINPLPPSDALVATLCDALRARKILTAYPDTHYSPLKQAIAEYVDVDVQTVTIGNGVMPLLGAAVRALSLRNALVLVPAFNEYRRVLGACGVECCTLTAVPEDDFSAATERVVAELKATGAQAVLLANPHNPSGRLMHKEEMLRLHEAVFALGAATIVDEAFIDYVPGESLSQMAAKSHGLVALRSLTKFFSMPGLRVAYSVAHPEICSAMEACFSAWPVGSIAAEAARLALQDQASMVETRRTNVEGRTWLADQLQALGFRVFSGAANYLLMKIDEDWNGFELWRRLVVEHRVVIRSCANFEGLDEHYFRIAVRTRVENQLLVAALTQVIPRYSRNGNEGALQSV